MPQNNVTIDIVSKQAGVSKTTISRYLNGKYEHMSEKTKKRIAKVIADLDYRPNAIARSLKSQKTGLIGVIVSDIGNPVMVSLVKGVIDHCTQEGYQVVTASSDEKLEKEREYILSMVDRQVEGMIVNIVDYNEYELLEDLQQRGEKIVLADRIINKPLLDTVTTDNYNMSKMAVQELYKMGYDVVGFFSSDLRRSNVRLARYEAFLNQSAAYSEDPEALAHVFTEDSEASYKEALADFMEKHQNKAVAIFASTPMAMLNLLGAAHDLQLRTPEDFGVLGYDNLHWTKLIGGGISVIDQPFYQVGVESAKLLINRIGQEGNEPPKHVELKSKLVLRNSTEVKKLQSCTS